MNVISYRIKSYIFVIILKVVYFSGSILNTGQEKYSEPKMSNQTSNASTPATATYDDDLQNTTDNAISTTIPGTMATTGNISAVTTVSSVSKNEIDYVTSVISVVVICAGLVGNILTILVIASPKITNLSSRKLLLALAVSDSLLLLTQPFNTKYMQLIVHRDLRAISSGGCKLFFVLFRTGKMTSSWFVVSIAVERFVAVWFPLKVKIIFTNTFICVTITAIYMLIGGFNVMWTFSSEIVSGMCHPDAVTSLNQGLYQVFLTVGSSLYSFIPLIFLVILTPLLIGKIIYIARRHREIVASSNRQTDTDILRVSTMILGILIAYIVCVTPITLYHNIAFYAGKNAFEENGEMFDTFKVVAQMLEQVNYSINFFIYTLTSKLFRTRLGVICVCWKKRRHPMLQQALRLSDDAVNTVRTDSVLTNVER